MRDEFVVDLKGKRYVLYEGLLHEAHERGLASIDEQIIQIPTEENGHVAICRSVVTDTEGRSFSGIGDASPRNVSKAIAPHLLRMASTRSKARAMRDMLSVGEDALEETHDEPLQEEQGITAMQLKRIKNLARERGYKEQKIEEASARWKAMSYTQAAEKIAELEVSVEAANG